MESSDGLVSGPRTDRCRSWFDRQRNTSEAVIWVTERCANVREGARLGGWLCGQGGGGRRLGGRWNGGTEYCWCPLAAGLFGVGLQLGNGRWLECSREGDQVLLGGATCGDVVRVSCRRPAEVGVGTRVRGEPSLVTVEICALDGRRNSVQSEHR